MRELLKEEMETNSNINLKFNTDPKEIVKQEDGSLKVVDQDGNEMECDAVMYAMGRKGKIDNLNLESVGVSRPKDRLFPSMTIHKPTSIAFMPWEMSPIVLH